MNRFIYLVFMCVLIFICVSFTQIKNTKSKEFYVIHTERNCEKCFNQLNQAIHTKLGKRKTYINYIFLNSNLIKQKLTINSLLKNDSIKVNNFKNEKKLKVIKDKLITENISPYVVIISGSNISVISYKELFINEKLINLDWLF